MASNGSCRHPDYVGKSNAVLNDCCTGMLVVCVAQNGYFFFPESTHFLEDTPAAPLLACRQESRAVMRLIRMHAASCPPGCI